MNPYKNFLPSYYLKWLLKYLEFTTIKEKQKRTFSPPISNLHLVTCEPFFCIFFLCVMYAVILACNVMIIFFFEMLLGVFFKLYRWWWLQSLISNFRKFRFSFHVQEMSLMYESDCHWIKDDLLWQLLWIKIFTKERQRLHEEVPIYTYNTLRHQHWGILLDYAELYVPCPTHASLWSVIKYDEGKGTLQNGLLA